MSFLEDFKRKLFTRKFAREQKLIGADRSASQVVHPDKAERIVVLFPAEATEDRKALDRWRDAYGVNRSRVKLLGYFNYDIGGATFNFKSITIKDLNWYGIPGGSEVSDFLKKPCDLLIRLGPAVHPQLDYLAALKPASLKVGPLTQEANNPYHLQFDVSDSSQPAQQLAAIARIFSYTNAAATS